MLAGQLDGSVDGCPVQIRFSDLNANVEFESLRGVIVARKSKYVLEYLRSIYSTYSLSPLSVTASFRQWGKV
ncbi:MAG: hypothetical protein RID07_05345, partial [Lacipirellulaceae bacterium]